MDLISELKGHGLDQIKQFQNGINAASLDLEIRNGKERGFDRLTYAPKAK
jgi:hypothetical protein